MNETLFYTVRAILAP